MLEIAHDRDSDGDLCLHDLGDGLPFRPGTFDGAISISAVQWLCNAVLPLAVPSLNPRDTASSLRSMRYLLCSALLTWHTAG